MLIEPEERPGSRAGSWYSRWLFERALALIYFTAFLFALNQFVPLLGKHGLLPVPEWGASRAIPRLPHLLLPVSHRRRLPHGCVARRHAVGGGAHWRQPRP
jgi:hypothetical protein